MESIDDASDISTDLPPALLTASDYESFVCGSCVSRNELLKRWAGSPGIMMVVRDSLDQPWRRFEGEKTEEVNVDATEVKEASSIGTKRPLSPSSGIPHAKRPCRPSSDSLTPCLAPPANSVAQEIFIGLLGGEPPCLGTGDLFLTEGFRERWCRCNPVSEKPDFGINFMGMIYEVCQPFE